MKKQLLALSIIAALSACSDDDTAAVEQIPAELSGQFSGIATKAAVMPTGKVTVTDVNARESLVYPATTIGQYGTFNINAAGEWTYTIDTTNEDVIALVSSAMTSLGETFSFTTADGTVSSIDVSIDGIDVDAVISGALSFSVFYDDGNATADVLISDANPAEAKFKAAIDQPNAIDTDGVVTIATTYGLVTITVTEPVEAVAAVEASPAVPATDTTEAIPEVIAVEAVKAVKAKLTWAYDLDESVEAVKALNYEGELAAEEIPTLDDTFMVEAFDGTQQAVIITIKGSQLVPALITGAPEGVDKEPKEGEEPVKNPIASVNINAPSATGTLTIFDPNFDQEKFQPQEGDNALGGMYGTLSFNEMGEWTYELDTTIAEVIALKGDGVNLPTPLSDSFTVMSVDGTEVLIPITIDGLLGGNLAAKIGGSGKGLLTLNVPVEAHNTGRISFKALSKADKDVKFNPAGNRTNDDWRTAAMLKFRNPGANPTGAIQFADGLGKKFVTLDQAHNPEEWADVVVTWDNSNIANDNGAPRLSVTINGTPITSSAADFLADTFLSRTLSSTIATKMQVIDFEVPATATDGFYIDNLAIYSDVAGATEPVFFEDFDDLSEGAALTLSIQDSAKTEGSSVFAIALPDDE